MDASIVKSIVDREIPVWKRRLGLERWRIDSVIGPCEGEGHVAECERSLPYVRATVWVDPAKAKDEADVIDSVRHESIHVLLGEFDLIWQLVNAMCKSESPEFKQFQTGWTLALERTVYAIETALDNINKEHADASHHRPAESPGIPEAAAQVPQGQQDPLAVATGQPGGRRDVPGRHLRV